MYESCETENTGNVGGSGIIVRAKRARLHR